MRVVASIKFALKFISGGLLPPSPPLPLLPPSAVATKGQEQNDAQ
jgi:hypothetical protein